MAERAGVEVIRAELLVQFRDRGEPERDADKLLAEARRLYEARGRHCTLVAWEVACALSIRGAVAQAAEARRIYARSN